MNPAYGAAVERLLDDCERQGLPRYVEDPGALAVIVGVLREAAGPVPETKKSARMDAAKHRALSGAAYVPEAEG